MGNPVEGWQAYAAGIVGLLILLVTAAPKIAGPVGGWFEAWAARRQRVARHTTAAEVAELTESVKALQEQFAAKRIRDIEHARWDRLVYRELVKQGVEIDPPPPLF